VAREGATRVRATAAATGERIDRYLARVLDLSRSQVQNLLRDGHVTVNEMPLKASYLLRGEESIDVRIPPPRPTSLTPEDGSLRLLHEDPHLLVVDKPAGLIVHPGSGVRSGTLVHRLLHRYPEIAGVGSAERPGIVHRLDMGTSGALAIARTTTAYRRLSRAFAEREVGKLYLAVAYGRPDPETGTIESPIGRHPTVRTRMAIVPESRGGRPARTRYRVLASGQGVSLLSIDLLTGRTHQIRVHCKAIGHPLVGDPAYGEHRWRGLAPALRRPLREFPRPALHARKLTLPSLPGTPPASYTAPVPRDLRELCVVCDLALSLPADEAAEPAGPEL
jgi:23S rRNA pseudouridine1911/1915/1917 synthase